MLVGFVQRLPAFMFGRGAVMSSRGTLALVPDTQDGSIAYKFSVNLRDNKVRRCWPSVPIFPHLLVLQSQLTMTHPMLAAAHQKLESDGYVPFGEILAGVATLDGLHVTHHRLEENDVAAANSAVRDGALDCETRGQRHGCAVRPDVVAGTRHGHHYFEKHFPDLSCAAANVHRRLHGLSRSRRRRHS